MATEVGELVCSITFEQLAPSGESLKKTIYKSAQLNLGRNEFREIILKVFLGKKLWQFELREIQIHKRFARDGKATIKLPAKRLQMMLSNCPPDKLIMFLKTMTTKLECLKMKGYLPERTKLLSGKPRSFETISPLTMKDLQTVHSERAKQAELGTGVTPKGKRKRVGEDKENHPPKGVKLFKKTGSEKDSPTTAKRYNKPILNPVVLTTEQKRVLREVLEGKNIFFTGSAGTGKSFLLRRIIGALPPQHTFATASTGVAACHIGGTTLHAFAGIGSGKAAIEQCVELASRTGIAQQWRKCKHLIIDEVSMVDGDFFDKLETVARVMKKSDQPFGGIQLILCGDFLQLPPVTKRNEKRKFAFMSNAWRRCVSINMELTEVRRQTDQHFISVLQEVRLGRCPQNVFDTLQSTAKHNINKEGILATRLCTHKEDVDHINDHFLRKLTGETRSFQASDSDPALVKTMNSQCPAPQLLELKEGAQVMLAKNLDVQRGLVNGARGVVVGFEVNVQGYPMVKFICGETVTLRPERWSFKAAGGIYLSRRQLPLKLAWAISIHKSQGMTLDCVEISLAKVFESGQAYVALSRAKSMQGLRVLDFTRTCVRADTEVLKFYHNLKSARSLCQANIDDYLHSENSQSTQW